MSQTNLPDPLTEMAERTIFTMVCKRCLGQLSVEMQAKSCGTCQIGNHDKVRNIGNIVLLIQTKYMALLLFPLQQLVIKSYGEFYAVRERPKVYKLGICLHQYDCRYGEKCKFAHGQAELKFWQGGTHSACVSAYMYLLMYFCVHWCTWMHPTPIY